MTDETRDSNGNILKDGDTNPVGETLQHIRAEATLRQAAEAIGWGRADRQPHIGRGLAIADQSQGVGQSTAAVTIDASGQVNLYMSLWDTGTGAHTVMRQIVAETLTLPTQQVHLVMQDTDAVPYESGPGGTRRCSRGRRTRPGGRRRRRARRTRPCRSPRR